MEFATNDKPVNLLDAVAVARPAMTVDFVTPITDLAGGKAWIEALYAADLLFHFEDSPENIHNYAPGYVDHGRTFTDEQCPLIRQRVAELYDLDWSPAGHECPIGYALEVMDRDGVE